MKFLAAPRNCPITAAALRLESISDEIDQINTSCAHSLNGYVDWFAGFHGGGFRELELLPAIINATTAVVPIAINAATVHCRRVNARAMFAIGTICEFMSFLSRRKAADRARVDQGLASAFIFTCNVLSSIKLTPSLLFGSIRRAGSGGMGEEDVHAVRDSDDESIERAYVAFSPEFSIASPRCALSVGAPWEWPWVLPELTASNSRNTLAPLPARTGFADGFPESLRIYDVVACNAFSA